MKVDKIGCECGADVSCFSTFKLQGPEGIGCVVGRKAIVDRIRKMHYSGGCQTQGWEALEVPVSYTHLDVYKRQQAERFGSESGPAALPIVVSASDSSF